MSDWPSVWKPAGGVISNVGSVDASPLGDLAWTMGITFSAGGVWPAANRALYFPFIVEQTVTAYQMAFEVTIQSGNCDVGLYDEQGNRLVSAGSTAVGAAGVQVFNITDTVLLPGCYFMAMNIDNTTAAVIRNTAPLATVLQGCGVQQQAVGAVALPDPATFANPASAYVPVLLVGLNSPAL